MNKKTLVFIKTDELFSGLVDEYQKLKYKDYKIVLVYKDLNNVYELQNDEFYLENITAFGNPVNFLVIKPDLYNKLRLDYLSYEDSIIYFVSHYFSEYDFYWNLESNVYMNSSSYNEFFEKYENNNSDILLANCHEINSDLYTASDGIFRISKNYAEYLIKNKKETWQNSAGRNFPLEFDKPSQFSLDILDEPNISESFTINFTASRIFTHQDGKIYYPVV